MRKNYFFILGALLNIGLLRAQIQYTDISPDLTTTVGANGQALANNLFPIDFNNDGTAEYDFFWFQNTATVWNSNFRSVLANSSFVENTGQFCCQINPLAQNTSIGPGLNWSAGTVYSSSYISNSNTPLFDGLGDRYIGVRFKVGSNTHYGWVLVSFANKTLTVKSYAYQKTPANPIAAGDRGVLSVSETVQRNAGTRIYPNPAKEYFMVDAGTGEKFEYEITDLAGRAVQQGTAGADEKVGIKLPAGSYIVKLKNTLKTAVQKLLVK